MVHDPDSSNIRRVISGSRFARTRRGICEFTMSNISETNLACGMKKLDLRTRAVLVRNAIKSGLISGE